MKKLLALLVGGFAMLAAAQLQAASDIFVRFVTPSPGLPTYTGDSTNVQFPGSQGWFGAESVNFGMENAITLGGATGGAGAGKAIASPLACVKAPNSASAALFTACATGAHWDTMEVIFTKTGAQSNKSEVYLRIEVKLVLVQELGLQMATGDDNPAEDLKIVYGAQRLTFYAPNPNGGAPVQTGQTVWSFVKNNASFAVI